MKIAFFIGQFPVASETFILNQITGLIDRGHIVDIYANLPKESTVLHSDLDKYELTSSIYYDNSLSPYFVRRQFNKLKILAQCMLADPKKTLYFLNIFRFGKKAISLHNICLAAPAICNRKKEYDIIQCHFGPNGLKGLSLKQLNVIQGVLVTTFHGFDVSKKIQIHGDKYYQDLWSHGDYFLPVSDHWKNLIIKLGCSKNKISIHRMGIDCNRFIFTPRFLQADRKIKFISVCRLVEKKGIKYSILAVSKLVKSHPCIEYNIIGNGPQYKFLKSLIQELNVGEHIHLSGWKNQDDIIESLRNSDILIAPSVTSQSGDQEGIPVSIMEAMAMGLPIVSTIHSGIPELVKDGVSGFLVPEKDIDALHSKLEYLIDHPDTWATLGRAGREYVEEHFNIDILNNQLISLYERLLKKQNHPIPVDTIVRQM